MAMKGLMCPASSCLPLTPQFTPSLALSKAGTSKPSFRTYQPQS